MTAWVGYQFEPFFLQHAVFRARTLGARQVEVGKWEKPSHGVNSARLPEMVLQVDGVQRRSVRSNFPAGDH